MLLIMKLDPANVDDDYFVDAATGDLSEGIELEANDTPDGLAHQLSFVASGDIAAAEFVVTGLDADGNVISETVTGVTTSPVETTRYFKRVDSIESENDISTATLDVGFVDEFVSPTIPLDWRINAPSRWFLDVTGTINVDVQFAIQDVGIAADQESVKWVEVSASLQGETADSTAFVEIGPGYTAARVQVNSYSSGAELTLYAVQPELPR
jgi:hypothetical protein